MMLVYKEGKEGGQLPPYILNSSADSQLVLPYYIEKAGKVLA